MSAAPLRAFEETPQRRFPRHPINVPLDLIALRSGVPETLPGRCTDISETGLGAVVAGQLAAGQQVALELRLPNVGVPVRARSVVRYQSKLRCGLEFSNLSADQREMIRYWVHFSASTQTPLVLEPPVSSDEQDEQNVERGKDAAPEVTAAPVAPAGTPTRKVRIGRSGIYVLLVCVLALAALGWWQWQRSWNELETGAQAAESRVRVPFDTMDKRIVTKISPSYPEVARQAGTEGMVVLEAKIAPDGSVKTLRPVSGPAALIPSATQAVSSWKFEPYLSNGKAVEVETTIAVDFRLN